MRNNIGQIGTYSLFRKTGRTDAGFLNERGVVLIMALLMLVMLGSLGVFVLGTSSTELHIAGNYRNHELSFYNADMSEVFGPQNQLVSAAVIPYIQNQFGPQNYALNAYAGNTTVTVRFICVSRNAKDIKMQEYHYLVTITGTGANNAQFTTVTRMRKLAAIAPGVTEDC
jgi:hypothetical protein